MIAKWHLKINLQQTNRNSLLFSTWPKTYSEITKPSAVTILNNTSNVFTSVQVSTYLVGVGARSADRDLDFDLERERDRLPDREDRDLQR